MIKTSNHMAKLKNIHPGEVLSEEFLLSFGISAYKLAKDIGIPQTRVSEILKGNRRITADTALRLSKYFGTSAKFWLGLQDDFDLEEEANAKSDLIDSIPTIRHKAA
jgi:addiction module HigA family antidote